MEAKGNGQEDTRLSNQTTVKQQKPTSINIQEGSAAASSSLKAPLTPRIDISRASSSSYHEDSSPENVFDQVTNDQMRFTLIYVCFFLWGSFSNSVYEKILLIEDMFFHCANCI